MEFKAKRQAILAYLSISALLVLLLHFGAFSHLNDVLSDKLYSKDAALSNIKIIGIDDHSLQKIGRWPWDRAVYSQLLEKTAGAKAVAFDISFLEPSSSDSSFQESIDAAGNVILAAEINEERLYLPVLNATSGYVNLEADSDGLIRSAYFNSSKVTPFAFQVYREAWNNRARLDEGTHRINFADFSSSYLSFADVLESDYDFSNSIVLVGATAPNLHDNYFVPVSDGSAMNGVEIHASILQNLILGSFITVQGKAASSALILIFGAIGFFMVSRLKPTFAAMSILAFLALYVLAAIIALDNFNYLMEMLYVPLSLVISSGAGIGVNYLNERSRNRFVTSAFGKYISKDLLKEILENRHSLKLGGVKRRITLFFSDIRGFTSLSESLPPAKLVKLINSYLTEMTSVILENRGTVDKFIGDAIMAFWNAPLAEKEHEVLACRSAIAQVKHLAAMNKRWKKAGLPQISIGCGLHTGDAIVGNMGSNDRFDYTALGDNVNLASRLEGLTKEYGVSIIASEETFNAAKHAFTFRKLDKVKVKGKKVPIEIYELCLEPNGEFISCFENALSLYFSRSFAKAKREFKRALSMKADFAAEMFVKRCDEFMSKAPASSWDGSWTMKTK